MYSRAVAFSVLVAFGLTLVAGSGADGSAGRVGGDFPAFYGAGAMVADGQWDDLYDQGAQADAQARLFPDDDEAFLYFAYPPHVAAAYRPLAALPYRAAYAVHSLAMVAAVVGALALLRPCIRVLRDHFELAAIATVLFHPLFRAVSGGQNTGLTLLLLALVWRGLHDDRPWVSGLAIALLTYKPQIAVPLLGLILIRRHLGAVAVALGGTAVLWSFGALVMGTNWVSTWWSDVSDFAALDADVNGHNAVSFLGVAESLFGAGTNAAMGVAAPLVLVAIGGLLWIWRPASPLDLAVRMALTAVGVLLISPHAMFYDAGLLALTGIVVADRLGERAHLALGLVWGLAWLQLAAKGLGIAPLFFITVGVAVGAAITLGPERAPRPLGQSEPSTLA